MEHRELLNHKFNVMTNVQKLTLEEKKEIALLIKKAHEKFKSWEKVANKCNISSATVLLMSQLKYDTKTDDAWLKVQTALQLSQQDGWAICTETKNFRDVIKVLQMARNRAMWIPISEVAGSGKTTALNYYYETDKSGSLYHLRCRSWGRKDFLQALCRTLGINPYQAGRKDDDVMETIIEFIISSRTSKPQIVIDQSNSLKSGGLTSLIHLFNGTEGFLSCILVGTENLKKRIQSGVKHQVDGYDELESRLGRSYIHLQGYTMADCQKICQINGITDKEVQKKVFEECSPVRKIVKEAGKEIPVRFVNDCRQIKRKVEKYLEKQQ